jgi:hypothetical protein
MPVHDAALPVDEQRHRIAAHTEPPGRERLRIEGQQRIGNRQCAQRRAEIGGLLALIQQNDVDLRMGGRGADQYRHLAPARCTPAGPQIQHQWPLGRKAASSAIDRGQRQRRQGLRWRRGQRQREAGHRCTDQ